MFATARVLLPGGENAVFVPRTAVVRDKTTDSYQVFTVENGTARLRVVVTGDADGDSDPHRQRAQRQRDGRHQQPERAVRRRSGTGVKAVSR